MGKNFSEFTYGVGLEITAQSFKQVKDELKLNLDNLSKMVKSYGKVLKIDPDADLSKLFDEMRKVQSIVDGINSSKNSFSGFVDKGALGSIAALEERLKGIDSTSDHVKSELTELKSVISTLLEPLKSAGEVKFPATFENLFGNFEDQSSKIKTVVDQIRILSNSITELNQLSLNASDIYGDMTIKNNNLDTQHVEELLSKFFEIRNKLLNISDMDSGQAQAAIAQIKDIGLQLSNAIKGFSTETLLDLGIDDAIVVEEVDELVKTIKSRKDQLATELTELKNLQTKFDASNQARSPSKKKGVGSLGLQSDVTAQVKVTPKANDAEWAKVINDTISNIEPQLNPVHLTPTFSKSKNISKEMEGNLSQINHAVNVDLKVDHNIEKFNEQINNIDTSIKNAKQRLEQNGNFKIKFQYEEGGNFRDVAYKIINQLKRVEVHVDNQASKNFLKELGDLRTKANSELKNIKATVKFNSFNSLMKAVDTLKAGIDEKIKNVDIHLKINNEPEIISQATLIKDKLSSILNQVPVSLNVGSVAATNASNVSVQPLSDAAQKAKENLEKCREVLASLKQGFTSPWFLELGDITPDGKKIKDSEKKLEGLLNKYKELKAKLPADVADRWQELYPEANGNRQVAVKKAQEVSAELKKVEAELNGYLQKQIAYTQSRYDHNQKILQQEKEIASTQATTVDNTVKNTGLEKTKNELLSINNLIKDLQTNGFKASEFLNLGDIGADGKKIEETTAKIKSLLTEYDKLKGRATRKQGGGQEAWFKAYPRAKGDMQKVQTFIEKDEKRIQTIESKLNQYAQKQIAFLSSRRDALKQILSTEEQISSAKNKQSQADGSNVAATTTNKQLATTAEDAAKKVKSLNGTLIYQKRILKDLEANGINSKSFVKVGAWDKETGSFKKFSQETLQLIHRYKELKTARENAGAKKVVGEEAQLRGKLGAILAQQKKHASEIIAKNQEELASVKAISAAYKEAKSNKSKGSHAKTDVDVSTLTQKVEQLTEKLNKARSALSSLKSDGISAVGSTGLKDTKGVLKSAGVTQSLKELVSLYGQLIAKKKELEASSGTSKSSAKINAQIEELIKAKQLLNSKGFLGLADTKIGDIKGRLGGDPQALNTLISQYNQLLTVKKEFEKSGDTTSESYIQTSKALEGATQQLKILYQDQLKEIDARIQGLQTEVSKRAEYIQVTQECQKIEGILADVHKNQVEYAQQRVQQYSNQLSKAQELLNVERQRAQVAAEQSGTKTNVGQLTSTTQSNIAMSSSDNMQAAGVVKLDGSTLMPLAKEGTLQSIDGKVGNILGQLSGGINITGSNISIAASNVYVSGVNRNDGIQQQESNNQGSNNADANVSNQTATNQQLIESTKNAIDKQKELKQELNNTAQQTEYVLSNTVNLVREVNGEIAKSSDTYKTLDRVNEKTENWGWVSHGENEPPTFEHTSTVYKTNMEAFNRLYQNFINALAKQKQIETQIATAKGPTSKLQADLEIQREIVNSLEAQLNAHAELYTQESKRAAIAEATKKANQEVSKSVGAQSDKDINKQNADVAKVIDAAQKKYDDMQYTMANFKVPMADSAIASIKEYGQLLTTLKTKQNEINANPALLKDKNYSDGFDDLLRKMQAVESKFSNLTKSSQNFLSKIQSVNDIKPLESTFDPNNLDQMHNAMQSFANQAGVGAAKLIEFHDVERTATFEIKNGKGVVQQLTVAYDEATNSLGRYTSKTRTALSDTQKFFQSLKHSFKNVARYLASFGSVYRIFAMIKRGFTYVRDIDSALTELKKVTDETDASYAQFLQDMSKTGSVVGATVKDLTTMAAEWARLGYSMEEAGKLAKSTAILLNVSEFDDAKKASEALISTMQAFKYTADESGHVVDILNEVGEFIAPR